jgi:plastocyanin
MYAKQSSEDIMKRTALILVAVLGSALLTACGGSSSTPKSHMGAISTAGSDRASAASLVVQHVTAGCHAWSLNGSPLAAHQVARLQHGNGITITNDDVMPHELMQTSGPAAQMANMMMGRMGAHSTLVFPTPGVYKFATKAGEDYTSGITTTGEDNVLTLTVIVT